MEGPQIDYWHRGMLGGRFASPQHDLETAEPLAGKLVYLAARPKIEGTGRELYARKLNAFDYKSTLLAARFDQSSIAELSDAIGSYCAVREGLQPAYLALDEEVAEMMDQKVAVHLEGLNVKPGEFVVEIDPKTPIAEIAAELLQKPAESSTVQWWLESLGAVESHELDLAEIMQGYMAHSLKVHLQHRPDDELPAVDGQLLAAAYRLVPGVSAAQHDLALSQLSSMYGGGNQSNAKFKASAPEIYAKGYKVLRALREVRSLQQAKDAPIEMECDAIKALAVATKAFEDQLHEAGLVVPSGEEAGDPLAAAKAPTLTAVTQTARGLWSFASAAWSALGSVGSKKTGSEPLLLTHIRNDQ